MLSKIAEITKIVPFTIDNQLISGAGIYTKIVDVDRDDWNLAIVTLWNKDLTAVSAYVRRMSGCLVLSPDWSDGYSQASQLATDHVYGYASTLYYTIVHHRYSGFTYAVDTRLSGYSFDITGGRVRIERGRINGSDVEIEFKNGSASASYLRIEGKIKLYRTQV